MQRIRAWLQAKYLIWLWENDPEHNPTGIVAFWGSIKDWWRYRPRIRKCACCEREMWWNGSRFVPFCSENCSRYGPIDEDEIPF